ncbi:hypothetical protein [Pedobacter caeni]|uniref:Uncharacterized protein n=1 Tax=Pedobacter caeni TaxID=288992 RepID=A0A1M5EDV2_9SPHI|nr:hypothetical protein [Pedobacter caeni]SHF77314.1 hypothetical protein SAMN04488522_103608 [Pedobacter caeni]
MTTPPFSLLQRLLFGLIILLALPSCKRESKADAAFYYWKQKLNLNKAQHQLLDEVAHGKLYLRFFDIKWDSFAGKAHPEAIISFKEAVKTEKIIPVIFITNQTFEKLSPAGIDSLAMQSNQLLQRLAAAQKINYQRVQFDCDWTLGTKEKYFQFLKSFKAISNKQLEATIRLHQVKYQLRTGVPPVDKGVLMFYNMGKLSPNPQDPNSIYNPKDAATYISYLPKYTLPLNIALPLFSWSIHIRDGQIIQVYGKIGKKELHNPENFQPTAHKNVYRALKSFFTEGIYVKTDDLFKLEETDKALLEQATIQLAEHLNKEEQKTIIYYEIGNLDLSTFKTADFEEISAHF